MSTTNPTVRPTAEELDALCQHISLPELAYKPRLHTKIPPAETLIKLHKTMNQKQIAEHFGVHPSSVNRWFRYYAGHGIDIKATK